MSAPFFPITNPGLEVCIETVHFFDDLSIMISETPELVIFFLIYFLILKSSIRYLPKSFFLANHVESHPLFIPITVSEEMVGHKLGEFAPTRTFKGHTPADKKAAAPAAKPAGDKK